MTTFLLNWKEGILFASLMIFLFTPWSRTLRHYILLGLVIYLLNQPLLANFHPGDMGWWLRDPAAWITAATWLGSVVVFVKWLNAIKDQGVLRAFAEVSWSSHFIAIPLIPLALFFFNLPVISPHFKTQADYSFAVVLTTVPLQYFIGFYLLRLHDRPIRPLVPLALGGVLFCVLLISLVHIPGTIAEYRALLRIAPTQKGVAELIKRWQALLEKNRVASIDSIRLSAYEHLGDLQLWVGDLEGAQENYKKALREEPDDCIDLIRMARILTMEGRTKEAREAFQRAIEYNPSFLREGLQNFFPPFQCNEIFILAEALEAHGRQEDACDAYEQALRMDPQNPIVNFSLGRIYFNQGDYEKAIVAFKKTLAGAPRHLCALSYLADIYKDKGRENLTRQYRDLVKGLVDLRIDPSDWKGRAGGNLYWTGGCYAQIKLSQGSVLFMIHTRGTPAQSVWPHMVVQLNEEIIGEIDVTSRQFRPYCFTKDVEQGIYKLWIYFTNDRYLRKEVGGKEVKEDRNLFVGDADITYVR
jgi:tetratricopeptide (TPR) repeat protein